MVLQSFLQYREFANSSHVKAYADVHPSLSRLDHLQSEKKAQGTTPAGNSDQTTTSTSPASSHEQDPEDRELPGNIAAERVEVGIREKARATPAVDQEDPFLVKFDDGEAANPQNWSWAKKWLLVAMVTSIGLLVGAAASINSAGSMQASQRFGVTSEVMELQTAVFLIGFGLSAPFLGALSEIGGRNPVYVITLLCFSLFEVGSALAPNIQTRVILRFFAGFFGSTPLSNAGGSIADIANAQARTFVFPIFAISGFLGPVLGPVMGGYLAMNVGQEWCDYLTAIWGFATLAILVLFMPETYAPVILKMKASHVREATGDDRYKSALEKEREQVPFKKHFKHVLALPFLYLICEWT
jgi:multidrug resistance protein